VLFAPHPLNNNAYSANGTSVLRGSKGFMVAVYESKQRADSRAISKGTAPQLLHQNRSGCGRYTTAWITLMPA
jgi:hypothetical protein